MSILGDLNDPATKLEMQQKHPHHELTDEARHAMHNAEYFRIIVDESTVLKHVKEMNNGAAPGYDGLTAGILKPCLNDSECLALFTRLVVEIVNGEIMEELGAMVKRGKLIAIVKSEEHVDDDGNVVPKSHRPILIGTFLYRLCSRIVNRHITETACHELSPMQLGISTPGAIEAITHNVRQKLINDRSKIAALIDIDNAFNSANRSKMIKRVMTTKWLEPIRKFVAWAYGDPSPILMPDENGRFSVENDMFSSQGVRQGDPLGSLLFAITMQQALEATKAQHPESNLQSYHDDTTVESTPENMQSCLETLTIELAKLDLKVQTRKSLLVDFHYYQRDQSHRRLVQSTGLKVESICVKLLGVPIGAHDLNENAMMQERLDMIEKSLEILKHDALSIHHTALILRISSIHKLDHWLRNVSPSIMRPIAERFDQSLFELYMHKLGLRQQISENEARDRTLNNRILNLVCAPVSLGGDGLTRCSATVDTCFTAGVAAAVAIPTSIDAFSAWTNQNPPVNRTQTPTIINQLNTSLTNIHQTILHRMQLINHDVLFHSAQTQSNNTSNNVRRKAESKVINHLSQFPRAGYALFNLMSGANHHPGSKASQKLFDILKVAQQLSLKHNRRAAELRANINTRARMMAIRSYGATRFINPQSQTAITKRVNDTSFQTSFCLRHGIEYDLLLKDRCYACGTPATSINNHELGCVRGHGYNIRARHDQVRDELASTLRQIGGVVEVEPMPFPNSNLRTDVRWVIDGHDYHFDVSIINPLGLSYIQHAAKRQLGAASQREKDKRNKYDGLCNTINAEFIPVVIESYGGFGDEFQLFTDRLRNIASQHVTQIDPITLISEMLDRIAHHVITLNGIIMQWARAQRARS
jgi:hypothetical protein